MQFGITSRTAKNLILFKNPFRINQAFATGSYLSAVTHYAAMFNTSVVGNTGLGGLDKDTALLMQEVGSNTWAGKDWQFGGDRDCDKCFCGC